MHHRTSSHRPSRHQSMCDICFCILFARKSQHASSHIVNSKHSPSHIDRVDTSRCAISVCAFSCQKITTCIIAHRPSRHQSVQSMCDIFLYSLGPKITTRIIESSTESTPLWRTQKSRFQPLVKMGMKTVEKNIDKKNKQ